MINDGKIIFGAYTPFVYDFDTIEQQLIDFKAAGLNFAVFEHKFDDFTKEQRKAVFDLCGKYGIDAIYYDHDIMKRVEVMGSDAAKMFDAPKASGCDYYKDSDGFSGHMFVDEPGTEHFDELGKTLTDYYKMFPGKCAYINLLPMYANQYQLTGGAWMSKVEYYDTSDATFQKYLDEYVEKVPTPYICTDIYPCHTANGKRTTYNNYIKSIEITADTAKRAGRDFWCCVQTCSWYSSIRVPNEADFRWQLYVLLSYGAKAFFYYIYAYRQDNHVGMCVNKDLSKNEMYNISLRTLQEIKRFEDVYLSYENLGAYSHNYSEAVPYLRMDNPYKGYSPVTEIVCEDPLLIGAFKKKNGSSYAFTLVNMSELELEKTAYAKLKIDGKKVIAYHSGVPCEIKPVDGYYNFRLTTGDGIFVTVE